MTVYHSAQPAQNNGGAGRRRVSPELFACSYRTLATRRVCARCGMIGADAVTRGWVDEHGVAARTRCVVGLDPDGADAIVPHEPASMIVRRHAHRLRWPIR